MLAHAKKWSPVAQAVGAIIALIYGQEASANPQGLTVSNGQVSTSQNGSTLNITASQNAFLNWSSFNIGAGQTTRFIQPSAASIVWNRITDPNPSQIFGQLQANGVVVLANQYGFFFGPNSVVKAASFVATTANIAPDMPLGSAWNFTGLPPLASIINYGQLQADNGGSLFLIAEKVNNQGILSAPDGNIGLYAGKEVLVSERPDGRGLTAKVTLPEGSVSNSGKLTADAGTVALYAQVVNQNGLIQANSAQQVNGTIELVASDSVVLGANSQISAAAADGNSSGGNVVIQAGRLFQDAAGSQISVAGGALSGSGGQLEISAPSIPQILSVLDGHAAPGQAGGQLVLDPNYIRISSSTAPLSSDAPGTLVVTPSLYAGFSQITLQANLDISLQTLWVLSNGSDPNSLLRLQAGRNIQFTSSGSIQVDPVTGQNWSVELIGGANFSTVNGVLPGAGSITLNGAAFITTQQGYIHLYAGQDVSLQSGSVTTRAGGNIDVLALSGDINTGNNPAGYTFSSRASAPYKPAPGLGGISTAAGGNVNLTAGGNITSYLPGGGSYESDGGSGAFGPQPGNVTVNAGGDVTGHFVVANGQGLIQAGNDAGNSQALLALSLVKGSWEVDAGMDINLQQVRNPNAVFNASSGVNYHLFDYALTDSVVLKAGNSVTLSGQNTPVGSDGLTMPSIYPPTLEITAGAGGISLLNDVILYPAPLGQLALTTTGGGMLSGLTDSGGIATLLMSDSGGNNYGAGWSFGSDEHASTPVHFNDPTPVSINISGDLQSIAINVPKAAQINVGGNVVNSSFTGQNLSANDVTSLTVAGNVVNRSLYTFYPTLLVGVQAPDFTVLNSAVAPVSNPTLYNSDPFVYNPATGRIGFVGRMTLAQLNAYQNIQIQQLDISGLPAFDLLGNPVLVSAQFLPPQILQYFYANSQDIPNNGGGGGYHINGPGKLIVTAQNADLGVTDGIVSHGPEMNPALAQLGGGKGADIYVNLTGDLNMYSSTIMSQAGGALAVNVGGSVQLGSPEIVINNDQPRGIIAAAKADVTVIAGGDINIEGSRIASYDGGNILVRSLNGSVNAGDGGLGLQSVTRISVDPVTGQVIATTDTIPGSGILATSFPQNSVNPVGNITVETPRGNINGGAGGIVQLSLNQTPSSGSAITLNAGSTLPDGTVIPGNILMSGSGVIGVNINLQATGNITGNAIARQNIDISSLQNVTVSALGGGSVNVNASGAISGTIIGVGSVSASGSSVEASLLSQNVQGGSSSSGQVGFAQSAVAGAAGQSASAQAEPTKTLAKAQTMETESSDDEKKKKKIAPTLVRTTGRVTVVLPPK